MIVTTDRGGYKCPEVVRFLGIPSWPVLPSSGPSVSGAGSELLAGGGQVGGGGRGWSSTGDQGVENGVRCLPKIAQRGRAGAFAWHLPGSSASRCPGRSVNLLFFNFFFFAFWGCTHAKWKFPG